jgi:hypothetical protein
MSASSTHTFSNSVDVLQTVPADPKAQVTLQAEGLRKKIDEEMAKNIIEECSSWLFEHDLNGQIRVDGSGKKVLSPAGIMYARYVSEAVKEGVKGAINQHSWAVGRMKNELDRSRSNAEVKRLALPRQTPLQMPLLYAGSGQKHWINTKHSSGNYLQLDDGTWWQVSPLDKINTILWFKMDVVTVFESKNIFYPYLLVRERDKSEARLIGNEEALALRLSP